MPARLSRRPLARLILYGTLFLAGVGALVSLWASDPDAATGVLTCEAARRPFIHEVTVKGQVESSANVDVACEAKSRDAHWFRILEVIPEGTSVQPGDVLVRLDSSALEAERTRQQLLCEQARASLTQARSWLTTARHNRDHYLEGEFALVHKQFELAAFSAVEQDRCAQEALAFSRQLVAEGYVTPRQFEADLFASKRARAERRVAELKLSVLERFTRPRRQIELESAVVAAEARLRATESIAKRHDERLADIDEQIGKCVICAPVAGEVVLNHLHHDDHSHMVAPGEQTMERRVLVRLPDPRRMQVKALVTEDKIAAMQPGVQATIELEAFPHVQLAGAVVRVAEFPEPDDWLGSSVKKYRTIVRVDQPPPGMRPGLSAEVTFALDRRDAELQLPCQAIFRHGDQDYCICVEGDAWEARPLTLGPNNGKTVVVREGLDEGEGVVLCAAAHRDEVDLPEAPPDAPTPRWTDERLAQRVGAE